MTNGLITSTLPETVWCATTLGKTTQSYRPIVKINFNLLLSVRNQEQKYTLPKNLIYRFVVLDST